MTPEEKSLLERTHKLAEENNEILRSMRRYARISTIMRVIYWVLIIGAAIGAFYFIQPYVQALTDSLLELQGSMSGTNAQAVQTASKSLNNLVELLR